MPDRDSVARCASGADPGAGRGARAHTPVRPEAAGDAGASAHLVQEAEQVVGMLLLDREDPLEHPAGGDVLVSEPADDLAVGLDSYALRDQVLLDHLEERRTLDVLRVAAGRERVRVEVRLALQ